MAARAPACQATVLPREVDPEIRVPGFFGGPERPALKLDVTFHESTKSIV